MPVHKPGKYIASAGNLGKKHTQGKITHTESLLSFLASKS
jgi:hypothetical protein